VAITGTNFTDATAVMRHVRADVQARTAELSAALDQVRREKELSETLLPES